MVSIQGLCEAADRRCSLWLRQAQYVDVTRDESALLPDAGGIVAYGNGVVA